MQIKNIKDTDPQDKPREKLKKYNKVSRLSIEDLISILLGSGTKDKDVFAVSRSVKRKIDSVCKELKISKGHVSMDDIKFKEFADIKGVGEVKALTIVSAIELGRRVAQQAHEKVILPTPEEVWKSLPEVRKSNKEHFIVILLDSRGKEIDREVVSIGTVGASLVHPREVFQRAITKSAVSMIGIHNHPSNEADPSTADIHVTERLVKAGKLLDIEFEDHIIVTKDGFYSFREEMPDIFD